MARDEMVCKADWDAFRKRAGGARCYVRMTDSFMSGWGQAEGKRNILFIPVMDLQDAYKLISWIRWKRPEMKWVDYSYFGNRMPNCIYDPRTLVQGVVYENWLEEAGCKAIKEAGV